MKKNIIIGLLFALVLVLVGVIFSFVYDMIRESDSDSDVIVPHVELVKDKSGKYVWRSTENEGDNNDQQSQINAKEQNNNEPAQPTTIIKKISQKCNICGGYGICTVCGGAGGRYNSYTQVYYGCTACIGSGKCKYCAGTGESEMVVTFYPDGSAIGIDTRTGQQYSNIIGVDNYLSEEEKSSLREGSKKSDAIDMVDYNVPNYTGEDDKVYCEKCRKVTFRHTHRTVR